MICRFREFKEETADYKEQRATSVTEKWRRMVEERDLKIIKLKNKLRMSRENEQALRDRIKTMNF